MPLLNNILPIYQKTSIPYGRQLKNSRDRHNTSFPPIKKHDGSWAKTDQVKASIFVKYLSQVFSAPEINYNNDDDASVKNILNTACPMMSPIKTFTPKEDKDALSRRNNHIAPGFDLITYGQTLKQLPIKAIAFLSVISNSILRLVHYPITWKFAQIIVVNKTNKPPNAATSYRPISLLPLMSKVLQRLLSRILVDTEMDSILPTHQFGFWKTD